MQNFGKLYIVASPIGNLADMSFRAVNILKNVDYILVEDSRHSAHLLKHYQIRTPFKTYHQHSDDKHALILKDLENAKNIALISDAGTPGINDPGNKLVHFILEHNKDISIIPIPGASALTALLSVVGHDINPFMYLGFLPHKKGRESLLKYIAKENKINFVFLDNPHRLLKNLKTLSEYIDIDREIIVARELTKLHETIYRNNIKELLVEIENDKNFKGELIVFVAKKHK